MARGLENYGQAVGVAPVKSDGPERRLKKVEKREQVSWWMETESGRRWTCWGSGGGKQPLPG